MRNILAVMASGVLLASCSSWNMSFDFMKPAPVTQTLRFESEPQGAEVRVPGGQACRTPCAIALPAVDLVASFSLTGYLPQNVPVRVRPPDDFRIDPEAGGTAPMPQFDPNPVFAALELQPPPPKKPPPRRAAPPRNPPTASAPPPPATRPPPPAQAAQPPQSFPAQPPASAASPWPAPQR